MQPVPTYEELKEMYEEHRKEKYPPESGKEFVFWLTEYGYCETLSEGAKKRGIASEADYFSERLEAAKNELRAYGYKGS